MVRIYLLALSLTIAMVPFEAVVGANGDPLIAARLVFP